MRKSTTVILGVTAGVVIPPVLIAVVPPLRRGALYAGAVVLAFGIGANETFRTRAKAFAEVVVETADAVTARNLKKAGK